jgi:hypothetical protein
MYGSLVELATFQVTEQGGKELTLRAVDFRSAEKVPGGSLLVMASGNRLVTQSPDDIQTAINGLWDEWLAAFPA